MENIDCLETNHTWTGWNGYSNYTAFMKAKTRGGWSKKSSVINFVINDVRGSFSIFIKFK